MVSGIGFSTFSTDFGKVYRAHNRTLGQAVERLGAGLKLNRAGDDVAAVAIREALSTSYRGIEAAEQNTGNAISMTQTADGALSEIAGELQDIRALAVQANDGTLGNVEKQAIQDQITQKLTNINDMATGASFNGIDLLDGSGGTRTIQTGPDTADTSSLALTGNFQTNSTTASGNINAGSIGGLNGEPLNNINVVSGNITNIVTGIDNAISNISAAQSTFGSKENGFSAKLEELSVKKESVLAARSRIEDTDFAVEASKTVKGYILSRGLASLSTQANANAGLVLSLSPKVG